MRVISVNVGLPRTVQWKGKAVSTCIFKEPVSGRLPLRTLNLDGDRQADLSVHGGPDKAVYVYPTEHYAYWHRELPDMTLPWGMFGENLTTEGLQEDTLQIGDRFRIGSAEVVVTQPRLTRGSMPATRTISMGCGASWVSQHCPTTGETTSRNRSTGLAQMSSSRPPTQAPHGQAFALSACERKCARAKMSPRST